MSSSYSSGMTRYDTRSPYASSYNYSTMPTRRKTDFSQYTSTTSTYRPSERKTSRYDYSSPSTYSTYGTGSRSRTPSASRARSPARTGYEDLERRTRALISSPIDTKGRPLPKGPGVKDRYGESVNTKEHLRSLRSDLQRNTSLTREVGSKRPVKADHHASSFRDSGYGSLDRDTPPSRFSRGSLDRDTLTNSNRLSRSKRTGSVADITSKFEDLQVSPSIKNSRKYGSSADLNNSYASPRTTSRTTIEDYNSSSSPSHSKHIRTTTHTFNDTSTLPDININNRTSRSPSLDGRDHVTGRKSDTDDETPASKRVYGKTGSRQNSSVSVSSYTSNGVNGRMSPDYVNNNKGIVGLRNIGNTCFMNSVLQSLSNTKPLLEYCLQEDYKSTINTRTSSMKGQLIKVYANVVKSLWRSGSESYFTPSEFKNQIARFAKRFVGYNQQDAQEFLIYLLEGLHEDVNKVQEKKKRFIDDNMEVETISASEKASLCWNRYLDHDNSKIVELFVGQLRSALTCTVCDYVSNTFDPFWDLSLPITKSKSQVSLQDCFDLFTQEEILDGDERPTCAKCKKRQRCHKRFDIQRFPKVLIIHLKRFNQGSYYRSKLSTTVDFPIEGLDLTPYSADKKVSAVYNLYAVSNHSGSTGGGHYTAYAKNPYTGEWHHFNDQRVTSINKRSIVSSEAYVLFYELQGTPSHL